MYYVLLFVALASIQWLICLYRTGARIDGLIVKDAEVCRSIEMTCRKRYCILICIEMILFAGFRALNVGADTTTYLNALTYYKNLPQGEILKAPLVYPFDFEVGYFLLTKICAFLRMSSTAFLFVVAILVYIPLFAFINKYSENPLISVLSYIAFGFFAYSVGLFRQMIAIAICFCGIPFIKKRKPVKYLLVCVLACLFHFTALIMIPLYWLDRLDLQKRKWLYLILIAMIEMICMLFGRKIIMFILGFIPKYSGYIGSVYDVQGGSYLGLIYLNLLLLCGMLAVVPRAEERDTLCIKAIMVACVLQSCSYAMGVMGRIVCYYSIYSIILLPMIANRMFKEKQAAKLGLYVILLGLIFYVVNNESVLRNYQFLQ